MNLYTEPQQIALALVPKLTALISLVSMSYAAQLILRSKRRMQRMYHRIFLGFAGHNMITSITFITGTWAIPSEVEGHFMNVGTERSCMVQAFFSELGLGSFMYLSALCVCACLAVRHNFQEIRYRRFEKFAHIACTLAPLAASISLMLSHNYGPDVSRCWVPHATTFCKNGDLASKYPERCNSDTPTIRFQLYSCLFCIGLPFLAALIGVGSAILAVLGEIKKRKLHQKSQGKILFMERARKKKSTQHITVTVAHLIISIVVCVVAQLSGLYQMKLSDAESSFAFVLVGVVAYTLLGFFHVMIYLLLIKKTQIEDNFSDLLERHSLRKSIRSVSNVPLVTGGYKPKNSATTIACHSAGANTTDFGIFVGVDEDEEDEFNCESPNLSYRKRLADKDGLFSTCILGPSEGEDVENAVDVIHEGSVESD